MIDPTPADIGRAVVYRDRDLFLREDGVITSFTESYVLVRYGTDSTSRATRRRDLEWQAGDVTSRS